jgi:hypothetical protein
MDGDSITLIFHVHSFKLDFFSVANIQTRINTEDVDAYLHVVTLRIIEEFYYIMNGFISD